MAQPLEQLTIAILEHRFTKELSTLFERFGAKVYACPLLEEKPVENREELEEFVRQLAAGTFDAMIFLTGVGARFLVSAAESAGLKNEFLEALNKMTIVVRGPKPVAALRQFGVHVDVIPENPTTEGVIEALRTRDLAGRRVGVQLYGTRNPQLASALEAKGANVTPVQVYAYGAAADSGAVDALITRILNGEIQVVAFTSAPQVRMLFDFAQQLGRAETLANQLRNKVVVASIGEVTSRALGEQGLTPKIVPNQSKMGVLAQAVADYFSKK
ncbi:MAG: uroporphyrinogen III synthase HEM4 [Acidobacteria bacterium]|nr:MAG: uroporphyrinogen III synthase HEM4 [Acidobacteriota bacterium]